MVSKCSSNERSGIASFRAGIWDFRGLRRGVKRKDSPNLWQTEFHSHISLGIEVETAMSEKETCSLSHDMEDMSSFHGVTAPIGPGPR